MTNKKNTKKALLTSVLCLLLCMSMLVGTTFAWFTDSVSTTNNIITAGNLDVNLYWKTANTDWAPVTSQTNIFKTETLWEPGHTEVVYLKVVNKGTLALKYDLIVNVASEIEGENVAGEDFKLSDYILYNVTEGVEKYANSAAARGDESGNKLNVPYGKSSQSLEAGEEDVLTMVVFMPTTVGNEANYRGATVPTINMGINLFATQYTYEQDSYGSEYDKDAKVPVDNEEDMRAALAEGGIVTLTADIAVDANAAITIPAGVEAVIDLNGHNLSSSASKSGNQEAFLVKGDLTIKNGSMDISATNNQSWNAMSTVFDITAGGVLNLENVTVENLGGTDMGFVVHMNNWGEATLNAKNCTFKSNYVAIRVFNSGYNMNNVTLENCYVEGASSAFWVHNYTVADFGSVEKAEAQKGLLNFDFEGSTFVGNPEKAGPIRYGMTNAIYATAADSLPNV